MSESTEIPPEGTAERDVQHDAKLMDSIKKWNALSQEERDRMNEKFAEHFAAAEVLYADDLPEWFR